MTPIFSSPISSRCPNLGAGIGLRTPHYADLLEGSHQVAWLEALTENYLATGGRPRQTLLKLSERYPIVLHGVSLSIGGTSPLDYEYLGLLRTLAKDTQAKWISDHLCWTGFAHHNLHDLLPLPFTEESLQHVVRRVHQVQEFLDQPILLENPSSYASFTADTISEAEFLKMVSLRTGCGILLDLNNVFVSSYNHELDARTYIDTLPADAIGQYHLAGHSQRDGYLLDSHIGPVPTGVWELYRYALQCIGPRSTLLEWDEEIPELTVVLEDLNRCSDFAPVPPSEKPTTAPLEVTF